MTRMHHAIVPSDNSLELMNVIRNLVAKLLHCTERVIKASESRILLSGTSVVQNLNRARFITEVFTCNLKTICCVLLKFNNHIALYLTHEQATGQCKTNSTIETFNWRSNNNDKENNTNSDSNKCRNKLLLIRH
jgi:hypothetical protein